MRRFLKLKVGLALGGGAARGMAHVGVLRAFEREKIPLDVISGTSMGAIIGGAYASDPRIDVLEKKVREVLTSDAFQRNRLSFLKETKQQRGGLLFSVAHLIRRGILFGVSNLRPSFLSAEEFASSLAALLPSRPIEGLPLAFGAVCLDLERAEEVLIRHGDLRRASTASSAIPGVLPPVRLNGRVLIDGGWTDKIPVLPAFQMGADVVLAVDITSDLADGRDYRRAVDIMVRADSIKDKALVAFQRDMADLIIQPAVSQVHWANFADYERCIQAGDEAATAKIPAIRNLLRRERFFSLVRPGAGKRRAELHLKAAGSRIAVE